MDLAAELQRIYDGEIMLRSHGCGTAALTCCFATAESVRTEVMMSWWAFRVRDGHHVIAKIWNATFGVPKEKTKQDAIVGRPALSFASVRGTIGTARYLCHRCATTARHTDTR